VTPEIQHPRLLKPVYGPVFSFFSSPNPMEVHRILRERPVHDMYGNIIPILVMRQNKFTSLTSDPSRLAALLTLERKK
jgi:hypothetical protein